MVIIGADMAQPHDHDPYKVDAWHFQPDPPPSGPNGPLQTQVLSATTATSGTTVEAAFTIPLPLTVDAALIVSAPLVDD